MWLSVCNVFLEFLFSTNTIVIRVALVKFSVSVCAYTSSLLLPTTKDVP